MEEGRQTPAGSALIKQVARIVDRVVESRGGTIRITPMGEGEVEVCLGCGQYHLCNDDGARWTVYFPDTVRATPEQLERVLLDRFNPPERSMQSH